MSKHLFLLSAAFIAVSLCPSSRAQSSDIGTQIAPGIVLPVTASVVVIESNSSPKVTVLHATEIKTNMHSGGNFARAMVYANQHHGIEIAGAHAVVNVQSEHLALYAHLPEVEPELTRNRITLLHLQPGKDSREVMQFSNNVFNGGHKRTQEEVAVSKEDVEGGRWVKLVPQKPLEPGEYAVTSLPKDKLLLPDTVYDFAVTAKN